MSNRVLNNIFALPNVSSRIGRYTSWINDSLRVKAGRPLVNWFIWIGRVVEGRRKLSTVKVAVMVVLQVWRLYTKNGMPFLVKYLKASQVLLMQSAGGHKLKDSGSLGVRITRAKDGLPAFIPRLMRTRIRQGDAALLTLWVSWLGIYRVFDFEGQLKVGTITDKGKDFNLNPYAMFIPVYWNLIKDFGPSKLVSLIGMSKYQREEVLKASPFVINKSSPHGPWSKLESESESTISTSMIGIVRSGCSLMANSKVFDAFETYANQTGNDQLMEHLFMVTEPYQGDPNLARPDKLGKLGIKEEAAGKVRVFAMVDCWTQWLLRPLHDAIFAFLKMVPQDGTFNQFAPVQRLLDKKFHKFWCYDLSAATDRLPILLQKNILLPILGERGSNAWADLLIKRSYSLKTRENEKIVVKNLFYAVGQPMGALSSWAMLALTHHFIVQLAARRAGYLVGWFQDYAVLGDDIVIANGKVAQQYLIILADLGVKVGLAKSLVSRQMTLEFAKRFIWRGVDCSPVSFKELAAAKASFSSMEAFMVKFRISLATLFSISGKGYKVLGGLHRPFKKLSTRVRKALVTFFSPGHLLYESVPHWVAMESLVKARRITHWDLVGWEFAMVWVKSYQDKFSRIEKSLSEFDGVIGETGLGLTDPEWFDPSTVVSLSHAKSALKADSRAISMMSMVMYYDSLRALKERVANAKDEWDSIKEFLYFHGPKAGIHWEILTTLQTETEKIDKLLDGLSIPKSLERRTEEILRDRPFRWSKTWSNLRQVGLSGSLTSSKSFKRQLPSWLTNADMVGIDSFKPKV